MLYAIGEIVLVTISILLALKVNNWNEKRIKKNEEIVFLESIENQFIEQLNLLDVQAQRYTELKTNALKILKLASEDTLTKPDLKQGLGAFIWAGTYSPGRGALEGAISSGKINLIGNDGLRSILNNWSGIMNETLDNEVIMRDYVINVVVPKFADYGLDVTPLYPYGDINNSLAEFNKNFVSIDKYEALLNNADIRSLAKFRLGWLIHSESEFKNASQECSTIIKAIQFELKNRK